MGIKLSVVLPVELVEAMNDLSKPYKSRSQFIEQAIKQFIANIKREEQNRRDLELINRHAKRLNEETHDALEYQIPL
jgi:metal-responsive CopG/Arc/MetJ family transcriptional regulator